MALHSHYPVHFLYLTRSPANPGYLVFFGGTIDFFVCPS